MYTISSEKSLTSKIGLSLGLLSDWRAINKYFNFYYIVYVCVYICLSFKQNFAINALDLPKKEKKGYKNDSTIIIGAQGQCV